MERLCARDRHSQVAPGQVVDVPEPSGGQSVLLAAERLLVPAARSLSAPTLTERNSRNPVS